MIGEETLRSYLPGWMLRTDRAHWGKLMRATLGVVDRTFTNITLGRLASMPGQIGEPGWGGFESIEALPLIARDRRILLGKKEPPEAAAARLRYWRQAWKTGGTPGGLLSALRAVLYPMPAKVRLVRGGLSDYTGGEGYWWTLDDTGLRYQASDAEGNHEGVFWPEDGSAAEVDTTEAHAWDWDSETWPSSLNPDPSRVWAIIYAPCGGVELSNFEGQWNDGLSQYGDKEALTGDAYTIGTTATAPYVAAARAVCAEFKTAGVKVDHILVTFTAELFDPSSAAGTENFPDGQWKYHGRIVASGGGHERVKARSSRARYWVGTV